MFVSTQNSYAETLTLNVMLFGLGPLGVIRVVEITGADFMIRLKPSKKGSQGLALSPMYIKKGRQMAATSIQRE
jgi:hypothetical protein